MSERSFGNHKCSPLSGVSGAVEIVKYNEDNTLESNEHVLRTILLDPRVKDRYVSVISIAGAFRQGKSLLLNFLLFYLEVKYGRKIDETHWLRPEYGIVEGFHYQHGSQRDTEGILMWSEVFLATLEDGKEVAIILMDTQGAFDGNSTLEEFSTIFALSTVFSSVQIYNLMRQIRSDDLNNLEYFAGQSTFLDQSFCKFQKLLFLVRDWGYSYEKPYGEKGGEDYLNQLFTNTKNSQQTETVVANLQNMFDLISCCLLPNPGRSVAETGTFQGNIEDLKADFVEHVEAFTESLLKPEHLVLKTVNQEQIKCSQLFELIQKYTEIFASNQIPQIRESLFTMLRDNFAQNLERTTCKLIENLMRLGMNSDSTFGAIKSDCMEIASDYFKGRLSEKVSDEELLGVYLNNLHEAFSALSVRLRYEHKEAARKLKAQLEQFIKDSLHVFERPLNFSNQTIKSVLDINNIEECAWKASKEFRVTRVRRFFIQLESDNEERVKSIREMLTGHDLEAFEVYLKKQEHFMCKLEEKWLENWEELLIDKKLERVVSGLTKEYSDKLDEIVNNSNMWADVETQNSILQTELKQLFYGAHMNWKFNHIRNRWEEQLQANWTAKFREALRMEIMTERRIMERSNNVETSTTDTLETILGFGALALGATVLVCGLLSAAESNQSSSTAPKAKDRKKQYKGKK